MGLSENRDHCKTLGGRLALVPSAVEMNALRSYMHSVGFGGRYRIDGTDAATEGVWMTETGEPMPFPAFTNSEPGGGTGENCLGVASGQVFDINCSPTTYVVHALCEY